MRHTPNRGDLESPAPSFAEGLAMVIFGVGLALLLIGALFLLARCAGLTPGPA